MTTDDFEELDISEFVGSAMSALSEGNLDLFQGCYLYDPNSDAELEIKGVADNKVCFCDKNGENRNVPIVALSNWTALIPRDHILNSKEFRSANSHQAKKEIIKELKSNGLPVNFEIGTEDLHLIKKCFETELFRTEKFQREKFYSVTKKLENHIQYRNDSFRIGRLVLERWAELRVKNLPADVLIHLAYYRRWTKDTSAALEVTTCLEGTNFNSQITDRERGILATERAAAYLDLFEKKGEGLQQALRFLKYSFAAHGGKSTPENSNCWGRYDRLVAEKKTEFLEEKKELRYLNQEDPKDIHLKSLFGLKQEILAKIKGFERAKRTKIILRYLNHFFTKEGFSVENEAKIGSYIDPKGKRRNGLIDLRVSHKNINHVIDIEIDSSFRKNSLCKLIKSKKRLCNEVLWICHREYFDVDYAENEELVRLISDNKLPVLAIFSKH